MVDGVCEPIAQWQWRVSASEPKAREREKVEKNSLGGAVDIVVDGVRTNCMAVVMVSWCKLRAVMARCVPMRTSPMKRRITELLSTGREAAQIGPSRELPPVTKRPGRRGEAQPRRAMVGSSLDPAPASPPSL